MRLTLPDIVLHPLSGGAVPWPMLDDGEIRSGAEFRLVGEFVLEGESTGQYGVVGGRARHERSRHQCRINYNKQQRHVNYNKWQRHFSYNYKRQRDANKSQLQPMTASRQPCSVDPIILVKDKLNKI